MAIPPGGGDFSLSLSSKYTHRIAKLSLGKKRREKQFLEGYKLDCVFELVVKDCLGFKIMVDT